MFEKFNDNPRHQERKTIKLKNKFPWLTRNEHLIHYKDSQEYLCNKCHSLVFLKSEESFMVCQECGRMSSIECDITLGRRAEINKGKFNYPYKRRNRCIEQLDIFLCRRPARVTKEDLDTIINTFKNKQTLTVHSRQSIKKNMASEYKRIFWRNIIFVSTNKCYCPS